MLTFNGFNAPDGKEFVDDIQMWTAVPEPGTAATFVIACICLCGRRIARRIPSMREITT